MIIRERSGYKLEQVEVTAPAGRKKTHYVVIGPDGHRNEFKANIVRARFWFDCWAREVERKQVQS